VTFIYLATPYTNYPAGREASYHDACKAAAHLLNAGLSVFCPIAHTHQVGRLLGDKSHNFWMEADAPFMKSAAILVVVMMDGWKESRGVAEEIRRFKAAGKPIFYMDFAE
jgi:nucleoside 2-deoxyribosyltransferase